MGMARIFGLCFAFLFASSVGAAVTIDLGPSDYKNFGTNGAHTGAGIRSSFGQTVRMPPLSTNLSVTRNPVVPYASAAARMRPFTSIHPASAAASAAIAGLFLAMEWYFDEEIGQWSVRELVDAPIDVETGEWRASGGFTPEAIGLTFPSAQLACATLVGPYISQSGWSDGKAIGITDLQAGCTGSYMGEPRSQVIGTVISDTEVSCPTGYIYNGPLAICQSEEAVPVIQGEYSRLAGELPNLPASDVAQGTGDAQRRFGMANGYQDTQISGPSSVSGPETTSTSTDPVTGDTIVTNTQTTTNISYGPTTITTTNTTTTNTYTNGQHTGSETVTETPGELPVDSGGGASGDWPGFCDWATVVCDWLDWTQEDPPPDEPLPAVIDDDFFEEKNISFGAKSCPPDHEISLAPFLDTTVGVSFQPLCDFAALIYYMVMAASYIIAAYISIGVARNA